MGVLYTKFQRKKLLPHTFILPIICFSALADRKIKKYQQIIDNEETEVKLSRDTQFQSLKFDQWKYGVVVLHIIEKLIRLKLPNTTDSVKCHQKNDVIQ